MPYRATLHQSSDQKGKENKETNRSVVDLKNKKKGGKGGSKEVEQILKQDCNGGTLNEYAKSPEQIIDCTQANTKQQRP